MREADDIWGDRAWSEGSGSGGKRRTAQIAVWSAKTEKADNNKKRHGPAANRRQAFPARAWRHEGCAWYLRLFRVGFASIPFQLTLFHSCDAVGRAAATSTGKLDLFIG